MNKFCGIMQKHTRSNGVSVDNKHTYFVRASAKINRNEASYFVNVTKCDSEKFISER